MHDAEKWSDILKKSCGENIARILKYARSFFNIMNERFNINCKYTSAMTTDVMLVPFHVNLQNISDLVLLNGLPMMKKLFY